MTKKLVIFGGGPNSLGENFQEYATESYEVVANFNLENGYDCTDPRVTHAIASAVKDMLKDEDELHVVNFIGMMDNGKIIEYDYENFKRIMFVNLYSLFVVAKAMTPLLQHYNGRFVTIGSNAAEMGFTGMSAYCATKHGAHGFIKCMAKELAPYDVPVNIVNPGAFIHTSSQMSKMQAIQFVEQGFAVSFNECAEKLSARIPMGRLATNIDLNRVLFALLNEYPRYYTGQAVSLSGGMVM